MNSPLTRLTAKPHYGLFDAVSAHVKNVITVGSVSLPPTLPFETEAWFYFANWNWAVRSMPGPSPRSSFIVLHELA